MLLVFLQLIVLIMQCIRDLRERQQLLMQRGLILKRGTIVDSTFIEAPSSTKNEKKERDPEAHSAKKAMYGTLAIKPISE